MFSDKTIRTLLDSGRSELSIIPRAGWKMEDEQWQPASVDLRLAECSGAESWGDAVWNDEYAILLHTWMVPPHGFCLGSSVERVSLGRQVCGQVHGKSSWARRGLIVHAAGFVDPGFSGELTFEIFNMTNDPITIRAGKRIAQITFDWLDTCPNRVYGADGLRSRYAGQVGPTPARDWK